MKTFSPQNFRYCKRNWTLKGLNVPVCSKKDIPIKELAKPCNHFAKELDANKALYKNRDEKNASYKLKTLTELSRKHKTAIHIMTKDIWINIIELFLLNCSWNSWRFTFHQKGFNILIQIFNLSLVAKRNTTLVELPNLSKVRNHLTEAELTRRKSSAYFSLDEKSINKNKSCR